MFSFIKRNLILFFGSQSNLFFSVMGALIAFILYLVFLKNNLIASFPFKISSELLDPWVISGTLTVTAITTTQHALSQMIIDREQGMLADFCMTPVPFWQLQFSYLFCAFLVGVIMQLLMCVIMYGYFAMVDGLSLSPNLLIEVVPLACLSSFVWTTFNLLCLTFVKKVKTLGQLSSIIGTAAGFFAGVYLPLGVLPQTAQTVTKLTPAPYNAALYRKVLMQKAMHNHLGTLSPQARTLFEKQMGIQLMWSNGLSFNKMVLIMLGFSCIFAILAIVLMKRSRKMTVVRV